MNTDPSSHSAFFIRCHIQYEKDAEIEKCPSCSLRATYGLTAKFILELCTTSKGKRKLTVDFVHDSLLSCPSTRTLSASYLPTFSKRDSRDRATNCMHPLTKGLSFFWHLSPHMSLVKLAHGDSMSLTNEAYFSTI
jgi:hypothetical protein